MTITAQQVTDSVVKLMLSHGLRPFREYRLPNGRRLDLAVLGKGGHLAGVEVKVSERDFNRDLKWADAMRQCKLFYFAVPMGFNIDIIHPGIRVIASDGENARIIRRAGLGLLRADKWHDAKGRYAVNPTASGAPLRYAPSGDDATLRVILP